MKRFHQCRRGTATVETVAIAPLILLLLLVIGDQFTVYVPVQQHEQAVRRLAWGKLRGQWSATKASVGSGAKLSSSTATVTDGLPGGSFIGQALALANDATKWRIQRVRLKRKWKRLLRKLGTVEDEFRLALVTDPGLGPKTTPGILDLIPFFGS